MLKKNTKKEGKRTKTEIGETEIKMKNKEKKTSVVKKKKMYKA